MDCDDECVQERPAIDADVDGREEDPCHREGKGMSRVCIRVVRYSNVVEQDERSWWSNDARGPRT